MGLIPSITQSQLYKDYDPSGHRFGFWGSKPKETIKGSMVVSCNGETSKDYSNDTIPAIAEIEMDSKSRIYHFGRTSSVFAFYKARMKNPNDWNRYFAVKNEMETAVKIEQRAKDVPDEILGKTVLSTDIATVISVKPLNKNDKIDCKTCRVAYLVKPDLPYDSMCDSYTNSVDYSEWGNYPVTPGTTITASSEGGYYYDPKKRVPIYFY